MARLKMIIRDDSVEDIVAAPFEGHMVVVPGRLRSDLQMDRLGIKVTNGSAFTVKREQAAFLYTSHKLLRIIRKPGTYLYEGGDEQLSIAFVTLREVPLFRFGTPDEQSFRSGQYGIDLKVQGYGDYSLQVVDPVTFISDYIPADTSYYTFDDPKKQPELNRGFMTCFLYGLWKVSNDYPIHEIENHTDELEKAMVDDMTPFSHFFVQYGMEIKKLKISNLEYTEESLKAIEKMQAEENPELDEEKNEESPKTFAESKADAEEAEIELEVEEKAESVSDLDMEELDDATLEASYAKAAAHAAAAGRPKAAYAQPTANYSEYAVPDEIDFSKLDQIGEQPSAQVQRAASKAAAAASKFFKPQATEEKPAGGKISDQMMADLKRLKELLDDGILTQEEYENKKKQILKM